MDVVQTQRKMASPVTSPSTAAVVSATPKTSVTQAPADPSSSTAAVETNDKNESSSSSAVAASNGVSPSAPISATNGTSSTITTSTTKTTTTLSSRQGLFARFRRREGKAGLKGLAPLPRPRRAFSAPAAPGRRRRRRRLLMEDHYRVDPERRVVLPGVPQYDANWARDAHDFFNLIVLIPVVALNVMNWNWDMILKLFMHAIAAIGAALGATIQSSSNQLKPDASLADAWTGEWFDLFFQVTILYFVVDLMWIVFLPSCVKSPATILQHHVATILYIMIPYFFSEFRWCMGACMIVEVNTWFLIARRVFNKQGFPPWIIDLSFVSIRVKLISVLFYVTWIATRCIIYPYLMPRFYELWMDHSERVGTPYNLVALCVPLHATFCLLNLKWTYDLLMSKIRFWTRKNKKDLGGGVDKGL